MACDPQTGKIRELLEGENAIGKEVIFKSGELISIRGCVFKIVNMFPNPHNQLILHGTGITKAEEANMI